MRTLEDLTAIEKLHIKTTTLSGKMDMRTLANHYKVSVAVIKKIRRSK